MFAKKGGDRGLRSICLEWIYNRKKISSKGLEILVFKSASAGEEDRGFFFARHFDTLGGRGGGPAIGFDFWEEDQLTYDGRPE